MARFANRSVDTDGRPNSGDGPVGDTPRPRGAVLEILRRRERVVVSDGAEQPLTLGKTERKSSCSRLASAPAGRGVRSYGTRWPTVECSSLFAGHPAG